MNKKTVRKLHKQIDTIKDGCITLSDELTALAAYLDGSEDPEDSLTTAEQARSFAATLLDQTDELMKACRATLARPKAGM